MKNSDTVKAKQSKFVANEIIWCCINPPGYIEKGIVLMNLQDSTTEYLVQIISTNAVFKLLEGKMFRSEKLARRKLAKELRIFNKAQEFKIFNKAQGTTNG